MLGVGIADQQHARVSVFIRLSDHLASYASPSWRLIVTAPPELDVTYFFNRNFAVELIAAVTPHNIEGKGSLAGVDVGDA